MTRAESRRRWLVGIIGYAGVLWLTAVVYGRALDLPFYFDDLDHLPYVAQNSLSNIWQSAGGFPYFRPLGATVWRLSYLLWGEHQPVWLHGVNLILHALNGWLVGWLAGHIWRTAQSRPTPSAATGDAWQSHLVATLAAIFFVLFPFSYQAVPWVGAIYHLLATTLVLTAVVSYQQWRTSQHHGWLLLGLLAILLAPFAHENGLIAAPLIAIYHLLSLTRPPSQFPIHNSPFTIPIWFTPLLIWFSIWWRAPKARGTAEMGLNHLEAFGQNLAYFAQGLAFPFSWLGGWLRDSWGWNDLTTAVWLILLALLFVTLTALVLRQQQASLALLLGFPLAWWLLGTLPALLLLDFAYVISAPRLLMLSSVGAALLWAITAVAWFAWAERQWATRRSTAVVGFLSGAGLVALAILPASWFIQGQMTQHEQLGRVWWQLVEVVNQHQQMPAERGVIFLNFPGNITLPTTFYPLGHEGTVFNVSYIPPERIYEVNSGRALASPLYFRRYDDIRPEVTYFYGVLDQGQDWPALLMDARYQHTAVFNTQYTPDDIWLEPVGGWLTNAPRPSRPLAVFPEHDLWLVEGSTTAVSPHTVAVTLHWFAPTPPGYEWTTFVHLLDKTTGELVAQADGHALANTFSMGQWSENLSLWDERLIWLPEGVTPEQVSTAVGLYNWQTGERLGVQIRGQEGLDTAVGLPFTP